LWSAALWALVALALLAWLGNLFGSPPPNIQAVAYAGRSAWLIVLWAAWIDRHRQERIQP